MVKPWETDKGFQEWLQQKQNRTVQPTRPVYENPNAKRVYTYSKTKVEQDWRGPQLKGLSTKQYGRSYDDKLDSFVKKQGGTDDDVEGFRYWMNKRAAGRMQYESEMEKKQQHYNNVQRQMAQVESKPKKEAKSEAPKQEKSPKKKEKKNDKSDNMFTSAITAAKEFFNPFDDVTGKEAVEKYLNRKQSKGFQEVARGANRAVDSASFGVMSNLDKKVNDREPYYNSEREIGEGGGTDMITTGLGYLVPGVGAYKALNATKAGQAITQFGTKGLAQRLASEGAKGAITGAAMSGAEVGVREALNPEDQNWKENAAWVGLGTATGAIADPLMYGAGKVIGKGAEKVAGKAMKEMLPTNDQTAKAISSVMNEAGEVPNPKVAIESPEIKASKLEEVPIRPSDEAALNTAKAKSTSESLPEGVQAMKGEAIPLREATGDKQFKEMGFWENAVNKVKKAVGSKNVYEQPISRREILANMRENLGVTIRTGRLNAGEEVKGVFKVQPEVIRSRQHGDIQVISHEIGHALDKQFKLSSEAFDGELMTLGGKTSGTNYTPEQVRKEGLAEFIRLFLTDPEKAVQEAPTFSKFFDETVPKKVKNNLLKTQADIDRWIEQGDFFRSRGKTDFTGKEHETISDKIDKVYSQFIDKLDGLRKVEKSVTGKVNSAEQSLYKMARNAAGAPKKAQFILDEQLKPIFKGIENEGITMKDISQYIKDVHALELETMGEKVAFRAGDELNSLSQDASNMDPDSLFKLLDEFETEYGIPLDESQINAIGKGQEVELNEDQLFIIAEGNRIESGLTREEINATLQKLGTPKMKEIQQKIVGYNNYLLDLLVDGQILTRQAVDAMKEKYPNYVPFNRFFEDDMVQSLGNGKGFADLTNPIKRMTGSFRDVIDPLESMVKNTFAVVNAVEKNKVGLELSRLADIEGAGQWIERLDGAQSVKKEHIVTVFENGEKVQYQLDKDLYDAIQQLDEDRANKVIQFLSYPTSMLRAGATLTPEFMVRNPIRDQFQAFVVSNYGYNPIIDLPLGIWEVFWGKGFNKSDIYKKWVMNGGGYGNYLSQDRDYLRETLKTLKREGKWYQKGYRTITNPKELTNVLLDTLRSFSEFSEEATKVGEFRKAMKKGATLQEAAYQSRDLMDFGRVGSDMRQWNKAVAFLNANLQGKDRLARAFTQHPVRTTTRALVGVTFPAIASYVAMDVLANERQREIWENTPKWMKDSFFLLPVPGTDEVARIPKPFDLAPMFANPVEQIMNFIKDNDPDAWDEFLKRQVWELLEIPHMLTGIAPIIENVTNYSFFTKGPIVPQRDQDLLPKDQYGVSTSLTARTIGNLTNTSPYKVDNLIRGYGAGLGNYATSGLDKILGKFVGELPPQEAKKWSELPIVNAFMVDSTGGGQIMTDFYDTLDELTKERNSAKRNQEGYKQGDEVDYEREDDYKYLNKTSREISDLRNEYREIQSSYDLSPEDKRTQLDQLDREMNELARRALVEIGEKAQ